MTSGYEGELAIELMEEFGATQDELEPMVHSFLFLYESVGGPQGVVPHNWLWENGFDPDEFWAYALERVRIVGNA